MGQSGAKKQSVKTMKSLFFSMSVTCLSGYFRMAVYAEMLKSIPMSEIFRFFAPSFINSK